VLISYLHHFIQQNYIQVSNHNHNHSTTPIFYHNHTNTTTPILSIIGPTAKYYNEKGQLEFVDKKITLVERSPKPEGYKYGIDMIAFILLSLIITYSIYLGEVSNSGLPVLAFGLVAVVALAAAVPSFFSIGESAKKQQKEFEAKDNIVFNSFKTSSKTVNKRTATVDSKQKPSIVVGVKKNFSNKTSAVPAAKPTLPSKKVTAPVAKPTSSKKVAAPALPTKRKFFF